MRHGIAGNYLINHDIAALAIRTPRRMDGSETQIATANGYAAVFLQIIQESHDQRRVELLKIQTRGRLMQALVCEDQELAESVSIGTDGVRARLTLVHQALRKEPLQQGSQTSDRGRG